ncbi:MAG: hypothetical protein HY698_08245 [Deltaproteobacteria bacterium]|nr:hypothetical protein [Deltaproteobacteria bacterium]
MRIRKFEAKSMKEAVALVKKELGSDAVIMSAKETHKGLLATPCVEVTAGLDVGELDGPTSKEPRTSSRYSHAPPRPASPQGLLEIDVDRIVGPLRAEMRSIRTLVRNQAEPAADNPLLGELAALREAVQALQKKSAELPVVPAVAMPPRGSAEPPLPPVESMLHRPGLTAESHARCVIVVGPSGVGKTTTIAKLASRDALILRKQVAMLSLDVYRVGAVEQIRAYADLIDIPLEVIAEPEDIGRAMDRMGHADRIYVDTGGRSPLDPGALLGIAEAIRYLPSAEVHLALAASLTATQMDQVIARHRQLHAARLIFTKCDEAEDLSEIVYTPVRAGIPACTITTGQRVPEDLEPATPGRLVELARRGQSALAVAA